ncbi:DUF4405 domain-containing protein [Rhizobium leguminosarum]
MKSAFLRYATPFITGLFLVSLVSGIALFLHLGQSWFRGMHEWLSMVLILPFILHIWRNWRAFANYFRRMPMAIALSISLAASLYYALGAGGTGERTGGPPQFAFASRILKNSISEVAPLIGTSPQMLQQRLANAGFSAATIEMPLSEVVARSGKDEAELVRSLMQAPEAGN